MQLLSILGIALALQSDEASPRPKALVTVTDAPVIQPFLPGMEVRELPVELTNINNLEYAPDGRLFAGGYDGRLHLIRDSRGSGVEDQAITFYGQTSEDYPLGFSFREGALYVMRRHAVMRHRDTKGDGIPDRAEIAATGWQDPAVDRDPLMTHRRVDDALGLAIGPDGSFYLSIGAANYGNGYLTDKGGASHVDLGKRRGCVLKLNPKGEAPALFATGVRFLVSMQFNRAGDLFATDQEGATWLPNGNPFDELLHLESGRHYGFPPRHPRYLPNVIDEPSVFDYGPQHQSTCGFRFNEQGPGRGLFGPASWEGDALLVAMSRGKLYRTQLAKSAGGYVARNQQVASFGMLPIDVAISPKGELAIACHGGKPDWGSGPKGPGRIFKITWKEPARPRPVLVYPAGPGETVVAFDRPLEPEDSREFVRKSSIEFGAYVTAGDRFERFRPGYQVVKDQMASPRWELPILSGGLSQDHRSLLLRTAPREQALGYALALGGGWAELGFDLTGIEATWSSSDDGGERWTGWLPHADLRVARAFTRESAEHDRLWSLVERPGTLVLKGRLDLKQMLQPAIQPGSKLDYEYPPETVTLTVRGGPSLRLESPGAEVTSEPGGVARLRATPGTAWIPFTLSTATGRGTDLSLTWNTADDPRPRAMPVRRFYMPWARPASGNLEAGTRVVAEISGGRWDAGKVMFFGDRLACSKCHAIRGEGGKIGPDLSNLIHRDYESVMKDIREPSAAINPDHVAYTILLKNEDVLSGVVIGSSVDAVLLGSVSGESTRILRSAIARIEPSKISLMPENLLQGLSAEQVRDLMTFLLMPASR
jgi:putative heme-binding domain-containing protein